MQYIDIHGLTETKLDIVFPTVHILVNGYSQSCRPKRDKSDGEVMISTLEDIPNKHVFHIERSIC